MVYEALDGLGPQHIANLLEGYEASKPLSSSGTGLLNIPGARTKQGETAFSVYASLIPAVCGIY